MHYSTSCTRWLHLKPPAYTQFRPISEVLFCSSAVMLLIRSAPPETHTAPLFTHLNQGCCALYVLYKEVL